jgi:hypothetical protein
MVDLEVSGLFAMRQLRQPIEKLGSERGRPFDHVSFLEEIERRLEIRSAKSLHLSKIRRNANGHKLRADECSF